MARAGGAYLVSAARPTCSPASLPSFRIGGVLVGSHAFAVLGNMLGVSGWTPWSRTEDVDNCP